jgi:hypothetical protein
MNIPNTFIIGAPKCGTSALAAYLKQHPNFFLSSPKEPFYWSEDYPRLRERNDMHSLDDYLALFQGATDEHTCVGEGSTNYLASTCAIENILEFNPNANFIVMLRNPIEVVHAFHSEILFSFIENEPDFERAWALQEARRYGKSIPEDCEAPQFLQYAEVADYGRQLQRFYDLVPAEQRKVIIFDDFAKETKAVFEETLKFLGLPECHEIEFEKVNAAHAHRYEWLAKLVLDPPPFLKPAVEKIRHEARRHQDGLISSLKGKLRKPHRRRQLRARTRDELCEFFRDNVADVSKLLGRDLSHWLRPSTEVLQEEIQEFAQEHPELDVTNPIQPLQT